MNFIPLWNGTELKRTGTFKIIRAGTGTGTEPEFSN